MTRCAAIRALPRPDRVEHAWDPGGVCVILTEDAPLAAALEERLVACGWRVAVLARSALTDGLQAITARLGRIAALIDIAPGARDTPAVGHEVAARSAGDELLGNVREEAWLFSVFRLARLLSPQLNAPEAPRTWFVAVTRIDGRLGLASSPGSSGVVAAGVYGLIKTLRLEWPTVCCRAIDLHPGLDAALAADHLVAELHDPDRTLGEVGYCPDGRWTIGAIEASDA